MDKQKLAAAFNEWMRRYIEEPERAASEWAIIKEFLAAENSGATPTYGDECAAFLLELLSEV